MIRVIALILMCFGLASCATPVEHHTQSGKPEVLISSTDVDAVRGALISGMLNGGYNVTSESDFRLAFDRKIDNVWAAVLLGSQYDRTPSMRITYSIVKIGGHTIRVVADLAVVTNPGSSFERHENFNRHKSSKTIQEFMNGVKFRVEAR